MTARALNPGEHEAFRLARLVAAEWCPYFMRGLLAVHPLADPGLGTFAVTADWRLLMDPARLVGPGAWTVQQTAGVLLHEVGHLIRGHHPRSREVTPGPLQPLPWNLACFPAGTLLPSGVPIEAAATMQRHVAEDLVVMTTQAGIVEATSEHPFWSRRRRHKVGLTPIRLLDAAWSTAESLRVGDFICVPKITDARSDTVIDLRGYVRQGSDSLGRRTFGNRAVASVPLDSDVAWLIGLYTAEGSASPTVRFSLGRHEPHLADRISEVVGRLGWSASRSYRGSTMAVSLGTTVFGRWLKEHCGERAARKHIPDVIVRHRDPEIRRAYIEGLVDGDGFRYVRDGYPWWTVATASESLMRDLVLLLAQDGMGAHTTVASQRERAIDGVKMPPGMLYGVSWNPNGATTSTRVMNGRTIVTTNARWKADEDGVWYPIKRLSRRFHDGPVFNRTTESHTYIAAGYLVHNCDAEVNDDLVAAGVPLTDPVTPTGLGLADGGVAEVYYRALIGRGCPPRDDDPGCGSGAGGPQLSGETVLPGDGAVSEAEADLIRRGVAQDVQAAAAGKGRGSVPAGMQRWAEGTLAPPKVPWTRLLRASLRRAVATARGRFDYTYARPSRRPVPNVIRPAMRAPQVKVTAVVDTSGSMSDRDLAAAVGEISGVLTATGVDRHHVRVLACDAAATTPTRVRSLADVELTGGGGTDMRVGITAALASRPAPDFVIVLTDGDTPWPDRPTAAPLVCVVIGNDSAAGACPGWATTVTVPAAA